MGRRTTRLLLEETLKQKSMDLKEAIQTALGVGRAFQVEGTASAKVLR